MTTTFGISFELNWTVKNTSPRKMIIIIYSKQAKVNSGQGTKGSDWLLEVVFSSFCFWEFIFNIQTFRCAALDYKKAIAYIERMRKWDFCIFVQLQFCLGLQIYFSNVSTKEN